MKRKFLLLVAIILTNVVAINAQDSYKPAPGSISVEVGFAPFGSSPIVSDGSLLGIYTLSEQLSVRLNLGFGIASTSWNNGEDGNNKMANSSSASEFSILPGIIYSFAGTNRLTPYVGAELGLASSFSKNVEELGTITATQTNVNGDITAFGLGAFTGFNYYFAKNLYVGAEVKLSLARYSLKNTEIEYSGSGAPYNPPSSKEKSNGFGLAIGAVPVIRLGWTF